MNRVVGMYLRDLLKAKGVQSPAEFGRRMNTSRQHAWLLWHGKTFPSLDTIQRLITIFEIDPADLATLDRETPVKQGPRPKRRSKLKKGRSQSTRERRTK